MTITEETRLESYLKTETNGRYKQIIEALDGEMTARQVAHKLGYSELNAVRPRLTELVNKGVVEVAGKAYDMATDRRVALYRRVM